MSGDVSTMRERARQRLSVKYEEPGVVWRVNYEHDNKSVTPITSKYPAENAVAQIAGMMSDFAQSEVSRALEEAAKIVNDKTCKCHEPDCGQCDTADEIIEAIRELVGHVAGGRDE